MPSKARSTANGCELVKTQVAAQLRESILRGELRPGEIISETRWGPILGAAQASVREAINLLEREGLVRKEPGRSARVTKLTQRDVIQAYRVRAMLEGLAARLVVERHLDPRELEESIETMKRSVESGDLRGVIAADQAFHLGLAELSGNDCLIQHTRQLLIPLFAFTLIRALGNPNAARAWGEGASDHALILTGIRSGDPAFAEQCARHAVGKFVVIAQEVWAMEEPQPGESRELKNSGGEGQP